MNKNDDNNLYFIDNINEICRFFIEKYQVAYSNINFRGKKYLLKYVNSFLRRWVFTTLVESLELSPANIIFEGNNNRMCLPVVKNRSKSKIGFMDVSYIDYSIENSPVVNDIRKIYEFAENGIKADDDEFINGEFYKKYSSEFEIDDPEYLSYIIYIAVRLGILNVMPSIGITMICRGNDSILNFDNKKLFDIIIKEAMCIAAEKLDEYSISDEPLTCDDISMWLKNENDIDLIFEKYFNNEPEIEDLLIDDDDNFNFWNSFGFETGITFDKWFLTPFGFYFGIIMPEYTTEYSLFYEMDMFLGVLKYSRNTGIAPTVMLYSPCTCYWLTNVGCEYFNRDCEFKSKYIFRSYSPEDFVNMLIEGNLFYRKAEIKYNYYPPFNVYNLRITLTLQKSVWFDVEVSEYFSLDELGKFILYSLLGYNIEAKKYKFYIEPENPFTEYTYPEIRKNSSNVYNTYLHNIFENRNSLMYSTEIEFDSINCTFDFRIDIKKVYENNSETKVPAIIKTSKNFKNLFYQ